MSLKTRMKFRNFRFFYNWNIFMAVKGIYYDAISATEEGVGGLSTAGIFATYPNELYKTSLGTLSKYLKYFNLQSQV